MKKNNNSPKKKNWKVPTISPLKLSDTLGKPNDIPSEEIGDGFPGVPGKFDNDGPS